MDDSFGDSWAESYIQDNLTEFNKTKTIKFSWWGNFTIAILNFRKIMSAHKSYGCNPTIHLHLLTISAFQKTVKWQRVFKC